MSCYIAGHQKTLKDMLKKHHFDIMLEKGNNGQKGFDKNIWARILLKKPEKMLWKFALTLLILGFCVIPLTISMVYTVSAEERADPITLRVGVYENPPKVFTDEDGIYAGFWPELMEYIAGEENWKIEWVWGTWPECLKRLEDNTIDIMVDVGFTEPRNEVYTFSNETVLVSWSRLYSTQDAGIETILDLEGKRIGVLEGSVNFGGTEGIKELVKKFDINCTFVEFNSYTVEFQALENNTIDVGATNKDFGNKYEGDYNIKKTPIIFQPMRVQFAFTQNSSQTPYLRERIDFQMKELKKDKDSIYYELQDTYFGGKGTEEVEFFPVWAKWILATVVGLMVLFFGAG
ncbi:MAG: substrate-binding periplasmic protein, partial [Candidatus Methanofastidiosia archaeon]